MQMRLTFSLLVCLGVVRRTTISSIFSQKIEDVVFCTRIKPFFIQIGSFLGELLYFLQHSPRTELIGLNNVVQNTTLLVTFLFP